jgi:hypothetical protein
VTSFAANRRPCTLYLSSTRARSINDRLSTTSKPATAAAASSSDPSLIKQTSKLSSTMISACPGTDALLIAVITFFFQEYQQCASLVQRVSDAWNNQRRTADVLLSWCFAFTTHLLYSIFLFFSFLSRGTVLDRSSIDREIYKYIREETRTYLQAA